MKTIKNKLAIITFAYLLIAAITGDAQTTAAYPPSRVDFDAYEKLVAEVKEHRKTHLVDLETFKKMAKEDKVIILDTRSDAMYESKHIKGAIHLNFSDFTQDNLAKVIPSPDYKILIYCNNNFDDDDRYFATKAAKPNFRIKKEITLALNIPTYINLYGYGYKNVYELNDLISVFLPAVEFEGTAVQKDK